MGHAYLFSGPPGCGKKTLALLFAQALNCAAVSAPCGCCPSCRKSAGGKHPDLFRLAPQGNSIKVEQLREIRESLYYRPVEGRRRICIIEDAELMTLPAASSILKILEEPPASLVFILLSSKPWALLPTVHSRCLSFALKPLAPREIAALLEKRGKLPPEKRELIVALSAGNPGQAIARLEEDLEEKYKEARVLLKEVENGPADGIFTLAERLSERADLPELLEILLLTCRDRLVCALEGCAGEALLKDGAEAYNRERALFREKICRALLQLQHEIRNNVNRRLALEVLFLQMRGVI